MRKFKLFLSTIFARRKYGWSFVDRVKIALFAYYGVKSKCADVWNNIHLVSNRLLEEPPNKSWEIYRDLCLFDCQIRFKNLREKIMFDDYVCFEPHNNPFSPRNIASDLNEWKDMHSKEAIDERS